MTFPSAESDLLMFWASFKVEPDAPVFAIRSLPARSTKLDLVEAVLALAAVWELASRALLAPREPDLPGDSGNRGDLRVARRRGFVPEEGASLVRLRAFC